MKLRETQRCGQLTLQHSPSPLVTQGFRDPYTWEKPPQCTSALLIAKLPVHRAQERGTARQV